MASPSSCLSAASRLSCPQRHLRPSHSCSDYKGAGFIKVSPEVSEALLNGQAVVALQSIIISHDAISIETGKRHGGGGKCKGEGSCSCYYCNFRWHTMRSSTKELARLVILVAKLKRQLGGTLHMLLALQCLLLEGLGEFIHSGDEEGRTD